MQQAQRGRRWQPQDPGYARAIHDGFAAQQVMRLIGASLSTVEPGFVEIRLPYHDEVTQQHGFVHGGIVGMLLDNACTFSVFTLLPAGDTGLTVEYKVNLVAPVGPGSVLVARGWVTSFGRTLAVTSGEAFTLGGERERLTATAQGTVMRLKAEASGRS
jgi:uncharacterized protein (TIGR00369 family)